MNSREFRAGNAGYSSSQQARNRSELSTSSSRTQAFQTRPMTTQESRSEKHSQSPAMYNNMYRKSYTELAARVGAVDFRDGRQSHSRVQFNLDPEDSQRGSVPHREIKLGDARIPAAYARVDQERRHILSTRVPSRNSRYDRLKPPVMNGAGIERNLNDRLTNCGYGVTSVPSMTERASPPVLTSRPSSRQLPEYIREHSRRTSQLLAGYSSSAHSVESAVPSGLAIANRTDLDQSLTKLSVSSTFMMLRDLTCEVEKLLAATAGLDIIKQKVHLQLRCIESIHNSAKRT